MPAPVELDAAIERFLSRPLGEPAPVGDVKQRARWRRNRRRIVEVVCGALVASLSVVGVTHVFGSHHSALDVATRRSTPTTTPVHVARLSLAPAPRLGAAATFDAANGTVVLFGGLGSYGSLSDTWIWDGSRWHEQHPRTVPPARSGATMAYDPVTRQVLMTGGRGSVPLTDPCQRPANGSPVCSPPSEFRDVPLAGDLWSWNGHDWKRLLDGTGQPRPTSMTTDERHGRVVLLHQMSPVLDTFTWSGSAWIYRRPSRTPIGANAVGIAFDATLDRVVAIETYQPGACMPHGGCTQPARTIAATWDGNTWQPATADGAPSLRAGGLLDPTTLVSDPVGHGTLALDTAGNTWRSKGHEWSRVTTASGSPRLQAMAIATDPVHHQVIAFGGSPISLKTLTSFPGTNDTWIWTGATWERRTAPVSAANPPPAPAPQDCALNGPALVPGTPQSNGTSIHIGVSDLFVVSPCHLTVSVRLLLIDRAGRPLAVRGNPATATFDADVTGIDESALEGGWTWTNPCALAGGVRAQISATGRGAFPSPITIPVPAPTCSSPASSTLTAESLTVHA